jgi:hypothetical protein
MKNHCWYKLNLDIKNCFLDGYKFPIPSGRFGIWSPLAQDVCNPKWLKHLKSLGLPAYSFMIFYRASYASTTQAHIDIAPTTPLSLTNFAINWCYGGEDSEMVWYEMPKNKTKVSYTEAKTPYMSWDIPSLKEIERHHIGEEVTIVKTGIPHAINMGGDPRWCFSMRLSFLENMKWNEAIKILKEKNLLIERDVI